MICLHCKKATDSDRNNPALGHVTCNCSATLHFRCLYPSKEMNHQLGNNNSASKILLSLFTSPAFTYCCPACRSRPVSVPTNNNNIDPSNDSLNDALNHKLEHILNTLDNQAKLIKNIQTNQPSLPTKPYINNSDNVSYANITATNVIPPHNDATKTQDSIYSATIENLTPDKCNFGYVKSMLTAIKISPTSIIEVSFTRKGCNLSFSSSYARESFLQLNGKLNDTEYKGLFFHNTLPPDTITRSHLLPCCQIWQNQRV